MDGLIFRGSRIPYLSAPARISAWSNWPNVGRPIPSATDVSCQVYRLHKLHAEDQLHEGDELLCSALPTSFLAFAQGTYGRLVSYVYGENPVFPESTAKGSSAGFT